MELETSIYGILVLEIQSLEEIMEGMEMGSVSLLEARDILRRIRRDIHGLTKAA